MKKYLFKHKMYINFFMGVLHPKIFFYIKFFHSLNFNRHLKSKNFKNSSRGVRDSTERPKSRRLLCKGYAKTNKYLGMLCYISWYIYNIVSFSAGSSFLTM